MLDDTGADRTLVKELEEYGVIKGERRDGETFYDDTEREIVRAVTELKRFGVGGRNLKGVPHVRRPRGGAARADPGAVAAVAEPERRKEALQALENLGGDRLLPQAPASDPRPAQAG